MKEKIKDIVIGGILFVSLLLLVILNPLNWDIYFQIAFSIVLLYLGLTWLFPKTFKFSFDKREDGKYLGKPLKIILIVFIIFIAFFCILNLLTK